MVYDVWIEFEDEEEAQLVGVFTTKLKAQQAITEVKRKLKEEEIEYECVVMYEKELDVNYWLKQCF